MGLDFIRRQNRRGLRELPEEGIVAFLEPGIEIEGQIRVAAGMVRLNCPVKGAISSAGTVIVSNEADVEGDIDAMQITIAGKVKGNVRASERLEITEDGILLGDVETPSLAVDPGAYFSGHCDMSTDGLENSATNEMVSDESERDSRPPRR